MPSPALDSIRKILNRIPGAMALSRSAARLFRPGQREVEKLIRRKGIELFQPFPTTKSERYPQLFEAIAEALSGHDHLRILSFGCASGEEVRALRRRLPHAKIIGIDPNDRAIATAKRADPGHARDYRVADRPPEGESFDAILALAVFRDGRLNRHDPVASCADILPFAKVERGMERLDIALCPGGLLALAHAQFRLSDMAFGAKYEAIPVSGIRGISAIYGRDDRVQPGEFYHDVLFRKQAS